MSDWMTIKQRKYTMSQVRQRNTKPERTVCSLLHRLGFRFRKNIASLPGKPDIVLRKYKTVIFVHGCFWHQHEGCKRSALPKSNSDFWKLKFNRNVERDNQHKDNLQKLGWHVAVIWECEIKDKDWLEARLKLLLETIPIS